MVDLLSLNHGHTKQPPSDWASPTSKGSPDCYTDQETQGPSCNIDCKDPVGYRYKIQILILNADEWIYMAVIRYLKRVDGNKVLLCALFQMAITFTRFNVQSWIWFYYGIKTRMLGHVAALFLMCVAP